VESAQNPYPLPAPAVVDPRSGAWEQHRGFLGCAPPVPVEEGVVIGVGRKQSVLERVYRLFRPLCPPCR
jgi:hypothetical protein